MHMRQWALNQYQIENHCAYADALNAVLVCLCWPSVIHVMTDCTVTVDTGLLTVRDQLWIAAQCAIRTTININWERTMFQSTRAIN